MEKNIFLNGIYPISPMVYKSDDIYLELIEKTLKTNVRIFQFRGKHLSLKGKEDLFQKLVICVLNLGLSLLSMMI